MQSDLAPDLHARSQAAAALRRLGHAIVGHHVDPALLHSIAGHVEAWLPELESAPVRRRAVARVTLGAAFEGAPGRAHGGIVAAVFDDTMGLVLKITSTPAYTGELTIRYLAPTPVGEELEFRARLARRDGRKLYMEAEARRVADGVQVAAAHAVFIAIDLR